MVRDTINLPHGVAVRLPVAMGQKRVMNNVMTASKTAWFLPMFPMMKLVMLRQGNTAIQNANIRLRVVPVAATEQNRKRKVNSVILVTITERTACAATVVSTDVQRREDSRTEYMKLCKSVTMNTVERGSGKIVRAIVPRERHGTLS